MGTIGSGRSFRRNCRLKSISSSFTVLGARYGRSGSLLGGPLGWFPLRPDRRAPFPYAALANRSCCLAMFSSAVFDIAYRRPRSASPVLMLAISGCCSM